MPSQHGLGLDEQESRAPPGHQPREKHQQTSLVGLEYGPLDLAGCDDQLLTKQGVLRDEFRPAQQDVLGDSGDQRQGTGKPPPRDLHSCCRVSDDGAKPTYGAPRSHAPVRLSRLNEQVLFFTRNWPILRWTRSVAIAAHCGTSRHRNHTTLSRVGLFRW